MLLVDSIVQVRLTLCRLNVESLARKINTANQYNQSVAKMLPVQHNMNLLLTTPKGCNARQAVLFRYIIIDTYVLYMRLLPLT